MKVIHFLIYTCVIYQLTCCKLTLNLVERSAFYDMSNAYTDEPTKSSGIYMTNAFDMPNYQESEEDDDQKTSGMFLAIARLNHSCLPNAQQTYIPFDLLPKELQRSGLKYSTGNSEEELCSPVGCEVLYATRDIAAGEELCDCYIELRQTTEERRQELLQLYRFHCTCPACGQSDDEEGAAVQDTAQASEGGLMYMKSSTDEARALNQETFTPVAVAAACSSTGAGIHLSPKQRREGDAARRRAAKLEQDIFSFVEMGETEMAVDVGLELIKLLQSPSGFGWGERYIAEACATTSSLCLELGRKKQGMEWLKKAHEWNIRLQGESSFDSRSTASKIEDLMKSVGKRGV
jgi:hypothetical protein